MYSVKTNVLELTALMKQHGITRAVLSPGSRNSPLNHTLASCPDILCTPVTDERSAAFTANGLCQALRRPVAACCTSGTALLDMAPAHYFRRQAGLGHRPDGRPDHRAARFLS